jgi:hypothetical protein
MYKYLNEIKENTNKHLNELKEDKKNSGKWNKENNARHEREIQ